MQAPAAATVIITDIGELTAINDYSRMHEYNFYVVSITIVFVF